ncbi:hypothetical protein V5799_007936 [Amblyomma americanum]|uniref:RNA-directed DNA polymerase n=1 Tax=Amblyomma americanum TaxID=6943 RepID=A0AAQ4FG62_AMBAM
MTVATFSLQVETELISLIEERRLISDVKDPHYHHRDFKEVAYAEALVYLNATKTLKPQIARWFDMLQEYTFDIRHRPGSKMEHVDAMSRAAVEDKLDVWMTISLQDQALIIQMSDEEICRIATTLEKRSCDRTAEERALAQNFVLKEGRLFRKTEANDKKNFLYFMPKSMRKSLCVKFHDLEGHFGLDRTIAKISETYWFPGMRRYVCEHIRRCFECLICKVPSGKEKGLLHPIPHRRRPFETIHADHLGPFVRSKKGKKYILVVTDKLTKYVFFTSRDTSAKSVIKSCEDFTLSFGLPERIITDQGTCFISKAFEEFCKVRGIQHVLNSTRHPHANGQVERVNQTLVPTIMTTMDGNDQREWDIGLKGVGAFLNTSYDKSTGRTPRCFMATTRNFMTERCVRLQRQKIMSPGRIQNNFKLKCERVYWILRQSTKGSTCVTAVETRSRLAT